MWEGSREKYDEIRPAVVVAGYKRTASLKRLLQSLDRADYGGAKDIPLVISLDRSDDTNVSEAAEAFVWRFGEKTVIRREERMGLKKHILTLGDLTGEYGSIILLEDDLFVSPKYYQYTSAALEKVKGDSSVGGVSLYDHRFNVFARLPFDAVDDGYDNFYFRFPQSWGQAWNSDQWKGFREWLKSHDGQDLRGNGMPEDAAVWGESSWLKYALKYAIEEEKYWFYPRVSYTTNFFDEGEHSEKSVNDLQVPLKLNNRRDFCFSLPAASSARYDQYFENQLLDHEADLYGLKRRDKSLTGGPFYSTEILDLKVIKSQALALRPFDSNILFDIPGEGIYLYDPEKPEKNRRKPGAELERYYYPGLNRKKIMKLIGDRLKLV